ncbi:hypothetical protein ACH4U7_12910 [Streptomyces sp. NPDC020845]|uniref:hypothetical protein n=1 Tax=Streptomyces sp. NPDC020845 TaxID=3365096 RepID=UPI00379EB42B
MVYEVRYGWNRKNVFIIIFLAIGAVGAVTLPDKPLYARILVLPFCVVGGLFTAYSAMNGKVALRVDETGVLFGGNPALRRSGAVHVPWQDITAVVLWRQHSAASIPYIGLARREGAPAVPGSIRGPVGRTAMRALAPHLPADVDISRPESGWGLDRERLSAAVSLFAPGVPVVDVG